MFIIENTGLTLLVLSAVLLIIAGSAIANICGFRTDYVCVRKNKQKYSVKSVYSSLHVVLLCLYVILALYLSLTIIGGFDFTSGAIIAANKPLADLLMKGMLSGFVSLISICPLILFFRIGNMSKYHSDREKGKKIDVITSKSDNNGTIISSKEYKKASGQ